MKQFLVTGVLIAPEKINEELLQTHMAYTQQWMDAGRIVMSALYADMTGVVNIVLADTQEEVEAFYANEPFHRAGAQDYVVREINIHYGRF